MRAVQMGRAAILVVWLPGAYIHRLAAAMCCMEHHNTWLRWLLLSPPCQCCLLRLDAAMNVLLLGATGATGRLVLQRLLEHGVAVVAPVRDRRRVPQALRDHPGVDLRSGGLLDWPDTQLRAVLGQADATLSCLGHRLTMRGIFGHPRRLVTDSIRRVCEAVPPAQAPRHRLIVMNTVGVAHRGVDPPVGVAERVVQGLLHVLIPPHVDNDQAAGYLNGRIGRRHATIDWCMPRPDTLVDHDQVSAYQLSASPSASALFGAAQTSRINVADVMTRLLLDPELWAQWRGCMPVCTNAIAE